MNVDQRKTLLIFGFATVFGLYLNANASFRFTNIICTEVDKEFIKYEYCYFKSFNRTFQYLSLRAKLLQAPVTDSVVRFSALKRANGYKPFLYNITVDACKYYRTRKSNPVAKYFYNLFRNYSNINHSCPYNDDLIIEKLNGNFLYKKMTIDLPMPRGEYCMRTDWISHGILRTTVEVFIELT